MPDPAHPERPPSSCDVLVVGAGPAGSACAQWLARAGQQVVLVDQHVFPRDKVCGDGLIPDAHHALQRLGVHDEVMAQAQAVTHVGCVGPRGGRVEVPGRLAVLPRRQLDDILKRAAERAGAVFHAPWRFEAPLVDDLPQGGPGAPPAPPADGRGRVVGARLRRLTTPGAGAAGPTDPSGPSGPSGPMEAEVRARWVVLATGAVPQAMLAAGLCLRQVPTGVALRGYLHHPGLAADLRTLDVVWHPRLSQGYGWVFPCRDGVFNIGVGLAHSHRKLADGHGAMQDVNLRAMFEAFTQVYAPAAALVDGGTWRSPLKGAPLRCSLEGAHFSRPGLLATGEAVGTTYAFTGEGIGKAMETGLLAAQALLDGAQQRLPEAEVRARYHAELAALKPRYDLYEKAQRVNAHPWLADLLIWRANRSPRILRRMAGVLEETDNPGRLVTARGLMKLLLPIG